MNSVIYGIIFVLANVCTREGGDHTRTYSVITQLGEQMTCYKCNPGQYYIGPCSRDGGSSECEPCPVGQYNSHYTIATSCAICDTQCRDPAREQVNQTCTSQSNILCICKDGFYRVNTLPFLCTSHDMCPPGKGVTKLGNPYSNTVCEICLQGYFSGVASKTEGCKQCTKCSANETVLQECTSTNNTICTPKEKEKPKKGKPYNNTVREICLEGYYSGVASKTEGCKQCTKCSANETVLHECTSTNNTVCTPKEKEMPKEIDIDLVNGLGSGGIVACVIVVIVCFSCCRKRRGKECIKKNRKPSTSDSGHHDAEQPRENGQGGDADGRINEADRDNNMNRVIDSMRRDLRRRNVLEILGRQMSDLCAKNDDMQKDEPQKKKQKLSYEINEKVWGFFAPHKKFYPATIVDFYNGKYKIKFIEDGITEYVEDSEVRKYK